MKTAKKIGLFVLLLSCVKVSTAQEGTNLLPVFNKLLLNPSFAGRDKNTSVKTGLYFKSETREDLDHVYYLTYDTYSEPLKGGIAYYFYQQLNGSLHTNETGIGFTFAKPLAAEKGKTLIPSFNLNYKLATKQLFVQIADPLNYPGQEFLRYNVILPKAGVLWDSPGRQIGLSLGYSIHLQLTEEGTPPPESTPEIVFFYSQTIDGNQNGLISRPYKIIPEFAVLYSRKTLLSRAGFLLTDVERSYGLYIENSFSTNLHGIGGIYGWNFSGFSLNLSAAGAYNTDVNRIALFGEIAFALTIPYIRFDKKNPWSTPKKLF